MGLELEEQGGLVKRAREDAGLTQQDLANRIGLRHAQSVSRYERGLTVIPLRQLRRIAEATGKPLSYFVGEEAADPLAHESVVETVRLLEQLAPRLVEVVERMEELLGDRSEPRDAHTRT